MTDDDALPSDIAALAAADTEDAVIALKVIAENPMLAPSRRVAARRAIKQMIAEREGAEIEMLKRI